MAYWGMYSLGMPLPSPDPPLNMKQVAAGPLRPLGCDSPHFTHLEVPPAVHVDVHQRPELDECVPHAPVPLPAGGHSSPSATHQCPPAIPRDPHLARYPRARLCRRMILRRRERKRRLMKKVRA